MARQAKMRSKPVGEEASASIGNGLPPSTLSMTTCNGHGFKSSKPVIRKTCKSAQSSRQRQAEDQRDRSRYRAAARQEDRKARRPHGAAHAQKPSGATVILGTDHDQRTAAQAAGDLQIPTAPTDIRNDEILLRHKKIH